MWLEAQEEKRGRRQTLILLQYGASPLLSAAEARSFMEYSGGKAVRESSQHMVLDGAAPRVLGKFVFGSILRVCEELPSGSPGYPEFDPYPLYEFRDRAVYWTVYSLNTSEEEAEKVKETVSSSLKNHRRKSVYVYPTTTGSDEGGVSVTRALRNLGEDRGFELVLEKHSGRLHVWRTLRWLDLRGFRERDLSRPAQDSSVSMPPALARTLLNIALSKNLRTVLDPFCGTGTILVEAAYAGAAPTGVDSDPARVEMATRNLKWAESKLGRMQWRVVRADARRLGVTLGGSVFDAVVTEPPFGPPLTGPVPEHRARRLVEGLIPLYESFMKSASGVLRVGGRLVMTFPRFRVSGGGEIGVGELKRLGEEAGLDWDRGRMGVSAVAWNGGGWIERDVGCWIKPE
ncbi:MAG: methyltransferase domain-containing protein [Candidatus Marsarchaeota archaeon]|nr:methyltransferase domain-containing protein [Candidatus Marsarchaeota archaeon]